MTDTRLAIAIAEEAGIFDAPTVVTWTEIFNLIDAARAYERKQGDVGGPSPIVGAGGTATKTSIA